MGGILVIFAASLALRGTYRWLRRDEPTHPISQFVRFCGWVGSSWQRWESRSA